MKVGTAVSQHTMPTINVRPNPASSIVHIPLPSDITSAGVEIVSITGQIVKATIIENQGNQSQIDVSDLASGVYTIRLRHHKNIAQKENTLFAISRFIKR